MNNLRECIDQHAVEGLGILVLGLVALFVIGIVATAIISHKVTIKTLEDQDALK